MLVFSGGNAHVGPADSEMGWGKVKLNDLGCTFLRLPQKGEGASWCALTVSAHLGDVVRC